jgi:hypothetical protein
MMPGTRSVLDDPVGDLFFQPMVKADAVVRMLHEQVRIRVSLKPDTVHVRE